MGKLWAPLGQLARARIIDRSREWERGYVRRFPEPPSASRVVIEMFLLSRDVVRVKNFQGLRALRLIRWTNISVKLYMPLISSTYIFIRISLALG